mmetsp:Transcript_33020/g.60533  ORF Transcript_33020/g.60533 Transcript_33020/m.60533 type:complete len:111 (-) Transcript_33020:799-1131(-)
MTLDIDEKAHDSRRQHNTGHDSEGHLWIFRQLTEDEAEAYCASGTSSADDTRDGSRRYTVDVRDNTIGAALSSLDEDTEDGKHDNRRSEVIHFGEDEDAAALENEEAGLH